MKVVKKILFLFLGAILIFIAYLVFNTLNFKSKQLSYEPIEVIEVNPTSKVNFSNALKIRTVSPENEEDFDSTQFDNFSSFLKDTYPLIDSLLTKRTFNTYSFLYKWEGSDLGLKPIVLMGHLDVVAVIEENVVDWKHNPLVGKL